MRILLIFIFVSSNLSLLFSQIQDSSCVKIRWIAVSKENTPELFLRIDTNKDDIFTEIKRLALSGILQLKQPSSSRQDFLNSINHVRIKDQESYYGGEKFFSPYFDYQSQGYKPCKNVNNEDSIISLPDGTMYFVYPETKYEAITINLISELRIMEERFIDSKTQEVYFKPTHVGFDIFTTNHKILFWVKLEHLEKFIELNTSWVKIIQDKKYKGFQYQQYSCNDLIYKQD